MDDFEELYRKHLPAVFRFSVRCVGRRDIAEEITSEAFLALYRNRASVDGNQLPSWLFTVVRNRAVDYWRRSQVERRYLETVDAAELSRDEEIPRRLLDSKALKPIHRVCLVLRYVQGMSRAEIAEKTGISETQVKGYLQYAREILRKELVERPK